MKRKGHSEVESQSMNTFRQDCLSSYLFQLLYGYCKRPLSHGECPLKSCHYMPVGIIYQLLLRATTQVQIETDTAGRCGRLRICKSDHICHSVNVFSRLATGNTSTFVRACAILSYYSTNVGSRKNLEVSVQFPVSILIPTDFTPPRKGIMLKGLHSQGKSTAN